MAFRILALFLLSGLGALAQTPPKKSFPADCTKTIRIHTPSLHGPFKFGQDKKYQEAPIIRYQIHEDGLLSDVTLVRSSGVSDIDRKYVSAAAKWEFRRRPAGCGIVKSKMTVLIHWDAS